MNQSRLTVIRWAALAALVLLIGVLLASSTYRPIFLGGPGLAQGALIAAISLGVVLTYRGSGVVNLANGAIAMYAAYVYAELRRSGDLFLPPIPNPLSIIEGVVHRISSSSFELPDIPTSISFGPSMQFWPALLLTLVFCILLGLGLHQFVFRPLRDAPPLGNVVASIGVLLLLQAVILRRYSVSPLTVRSMPFVDKSKIDVGITSLSQEQLFVVVLVVVLSIALRLLFTRTSFGLATRAAAENERGAICLGLSPDRLAAINWILSTTVTGLMGVFVASINSNVDPLVIPALIVPAVCAALVGGFQSFGVTVLASFLLGMQIPLIQAFGVREDWFPRAGSFAIPGVETLVPLVVIGIVLFLRGDALPGRGAVDVGKLPAAPTPTTRALTTFTPIGVVVTLLATLFVLSPDYRGALTNTLIGIIVCLSVVVVTGYVGQLALAPMAFGGIAAFLVSKLSSDLGWPFPLPILAATLIAGGVGFLVALPALRIRGVSLAIVTLAFGVACERFVFANQDVNGGLEGAPVDGPSVIEQTRLVSREILGFLTVGDGKQPNPLTTVFCLVVVVVLGYIVANVRSSNTGRQMLAVRANERAAAAAGVNVAATKATAFIISAMIAGVAGSVIAYRSGAANEERFTYMQGLLFFAFAYLGGITRISGAVIGGLLVSNGLAFTFGERTLGIPPEFSLLLGGIGLVFAAATNPEGIAASTSQRIRSLRTRLVARRG